MVGERRSGHLGKLNAKGFLKSAGMDPTLDNYKATQTAFSSLETISGLPAEWRLAGELMVARFVYYVYVFL